MLAPMQYKLVLLSRFRRVRVEPALRHFLPPGCQLVQCFGARAAMANQVATDRGPGPPDPAPAMQLDLPPCMQTLVDRIQDVIHLFG